jgi:molybdate transport system substrate-binding protein
MRALLALAAIVVSQAATAQEPVRLYAAGSLRAALNEVAAAFTAATGTKLVAEFGASPAGQAILKRHGFTTVTSAETSK